MTKVVDGRAPEEVCGQCRYLGPDNSNFITWCINTKSKHYAHLIRPEHPSCLDFVKSKEGG